MNIDKQVQLFEKQANKYAKDVYRKTSDQKMRRRLLEFAKGNILEVSVGAGINFQYYPKDSVVTAVDFSPAMIEKAKKVANEQGLQVNFVVANVEEIQMHEKAYDTVVSTLSMCAYPNPEKVLKMLASMCKDDGQILLFEHSISSVSIIGWIQNKTNAIISKRIGCNINRDILKIIQESPLQIEKIESLFLNSVHLIWAKPTK